MTIPGVSQSAFSSDYASGAINAISSITGVPSSRILMSGLKMAASAAGRRKLLQEAAAANAAAAPGGAPAAGAQAAQAAGAQSTDGVSAPSRRPACRSL